MAASRPSSAVYLLLVLTDVALASATCPGGWARFDEGGKCYKVTAGRFNALGCAAACGENATLACIRSSSEADFIASLTRSVGDVWIGLYQSAGAVEPGGGWDTCASGVTTNFTNWLSGYPSNFYRTMIFGDLGELSYANRQCAAKRREYLRNGWFDSPCYLRYRCLCELGAPASAEYLAFMEADIAKGQQLLRTLTGILYGGLIPAAWLVPLAFFCALLACLRLRRKKAPAQEADASFKGGSGSFKGDSGSFKACGEANERRSSTTRLSSSNFLSSAFNVLSSARDVGSPQSTKRGAKRSRSFRHEHPTLTEQKLKRRLTDAVAKANRLRLRVSFTLAQLGWMLLALTGVPALFGNFVDVDLTPIASNIISYYFAFLPGAAVILLALRPTYATPIRIVGVLGVIFSAAALYAALVPLWSVESSASTAGVSVFALNIIRSSGLALIAAIVCALLWDTMGVRFVCRNSEQFKAAGTKLQAIQRGKTAAHELSKAKRAYDLEAAKDTESKEASSAKSAFENARQRDEAAKRHLEFLKKLKESTSGGHQQTKAIDLYKEFLNTQDMDKAAALKELAEHIEASQCEPGRLKAIQSTSKNTATVAIQSNAFRMRVLTTPPLNLWFALRLAFIGDVVYYHNWKSNETSWRKPDELTQWERDREQEKAQTKIASAMDKAQTKIASAFRGYLARSKKSKMKAAAVAVAVNDPLNKLMLKVEADPRLVNMTRAIAERVLTNEGGNVGKAFNRLTHNKGTHFNDITFAGAAKMSLVKNKWGGSMKKLQASRNAEKAAAKPDELEGELEAAQERAVVAAQTGQTAWMEFTLEYTMGARSQLLRLWLTLRIVCIGFALLYLVIFLSMMLHGPSVDPYGADPVEAGAIENVILSAIALAVALVFTRANRGRFIAWLGTLGKSDDKSESATKSEATALAALIGNKSPAEALTLGIGRFRALPLAKLMREDITGRKAGEVAGSWNTSPGFPTPKLYQKTFRVGQPGGPKFGEVDAFISHSWSDDGDAKYDCLKEWEAREKATEPTAETAGAGPSVLTRAGAPGKVTADGNGGSNRLNGVTIWLDKACLDQRDIQASLAGLPIFIAGCKQLLVLAGPTYASRLWCVIELFVFVQLTPKDQRQNRMQVMFLTSKDKNSKEVSMMTKVFEEGLESFDAGKAETFDPNDRQRLLAVIEASFGTLDPFNKIVQGISKDHYKRTMTKRASVKCSTPEQAKRLNKMNTQQIRFAAEITDDYDA